MKINVLKPDNNCVIIDEEYYRYLKEKSELNADEIEKNCRGKIFEIHQGWQYNKSDLSD